MGKIGVGPQTLPVGNLYIAGTPSPTTLNATITPAVTVQVLWDFPSGGSCNSGPAISQGVVYWGSGYARFGTPNNQFYAFGLP